ncbi:glycosyltransferase family 4 protein [Terriglobus tenax]|uniref:glycosyltransferase family 4 protein n=1 Tax=Terriglobus tenax TaxID=1111115 RepID=UPI0021E091B9|nr:glycosyltransferase family 4 protein [Terriglobus tenax]
MKNSSQEWTVSFLLPTLRVGGGVREAIKLAKDLQDRGCAVQIITMWSHPAEGAATGLPVLHLLPSMPTKAGAWKDLPRIAYLLRKHLRRRTGTANRRNILFATHFSTLPFLFFVANRTRYVFVQDLEWTFVARGWKQHLLKSAILFFYRYTSLVVANQYLKKKLQEIGLLPLCETAIWALSDFSSKAPNVGRSFDFVMVLRDGAHKRLDLYMSLLALLRTCGSIRTACITPDENIATMAAPLTDRILLRPSVEEMRDLYSDTKVFLLLSDHEGFALPPLEAMASGCVPLCRDCGGVSAYMQGILANNIVPLSHNLDQIAERACALAGDELLLSQLSCAARNEFEAGLLRSQETRAESLTMLAQIFSDPEPNGEPL